MKCLDMCNIHFWKLTPERVISECREHEVVYSLFGEEDSRPQIVLTHSQTIATHLGQMHLLIV